MGINLSTIRGHEASVARSDGGVSALEKTLHVLTLTPFYPSARDDAQGCFVAEPLPGLARRGIVNTVMAAQPFYRLDAMANGESNWAEQVRFAAIPGNFGLAASGGLLFASLLSKVRKLHRLNPIHVIHAHAALPCGHAAALLSRELGIPFAITVHGLDAYFTDQVSGRFGIWCQNISKFVYGSASRVICISEKVRDRVISKAQGAIRTEVVYNGVDAEKFHPGGGGVGGATILCVANFIPVKGHEFFLRAFASLREEFPEWSCELIGDGPLRSKIEAIASELKIKVIFRGRKSREEVAEAMRRCSIFALPSSYEGLGCVYLEAMATARATIGCWRQGIEEVIEHGANGWLINPGSIEELSNALRELMGNERLRADLGRQARRTILGGFTLDHQAELLARIFRECCG